MGSNFSSLQDTQNPSILLCLCITNDAERQLGLFAFKSVASKNVECCISNCFKYALRIRVSVLLKLSLQSGKTSHQKISFTESRKSSQRNKIWSGMWTLQGSFMWLGFWRGFGCDFSSISTDTTPVTSNISWILSCSAFKKFSRTRTASPEWFFWNFSPWFGFCSQRFRWERRQRCTSTRSSWSFNCSWKCHNILYHQPGWLRFLCREKIQTSNLNK